MKKEKVGITILILFITITTSINIVSLNKTSKLLGTVPSRNINSNEVEYAENKSVQGAINDLAEKANIIGTDEEKNKFRDDSKTLISEVNKKTNYPDYSKRTILYNSTAGTNDKDASTTGTISEDGYIQASVETSTTQGYPFIRIFINDEVVYAYQAKFDNIYLYAYSPLFPVKKEDSYKIELSGPNGSRRIVKFFPGR